MAKKKRIGRYKILGELGRGAMGIVYKAQDPALDRVVALKTIILEEDSEGRSDFHKRFFLEAKAAGKLTHPHIVTTYDFGEEGDVAYMAMELLDGIDLRQRLDEGRLPTIDAVDIARQVADGLGFAHERGVVHRDIKPANIMLLDRAQAKITDFGIARMRSADHKTSTGVVLGTPRYMSPEQVSGFPVDHRSDIFSLGAVLYEMLTGVPLFAGEATPQIAHNVVNLEHVPPSRSNDEVKPMLDFVVARALKKDPDVRYQDAYEFASDLRTCFAELMARKPDSSGAQTTKTLKLDPTEGSRALAPAAGAIAPDTRLPLSRQFDSSVALERLSGPRVSARLTREPRPAGLFRRVWNDAGPRLLFFAALLGAAAGSYIAFG